MTSPVAIDPLESVNDLVRRLPDALPVLNAFGLDTCCGGALSLADAARANGLAVDDLLDAIRAAVAAR